MTRKLLTAFLPLLILIAIPLLLRQATAESPPGVSGESTDRLVIITPNSESIRYEFTRAFREHYRRLSGREVEIEWRTPGGTSDIVRFIADRFESAFRNYWTGNPANSPWNGELAAGFNDPRAVPGSKVSANVIAARKQFLASDVSIGVDLFFGGGQYDHQRQANKGYAVDAGIQKLHPEWFCPEVIPQQFSGEKFYDPHGRYYGSCLATFGICWNKDRIKELFVSPPKSWLDLGRGQFFRQLAIADPTKSGSVNKCFEMIVQQQMAAAVAKYPANGLKNGWADGLNLIKRIAANSRVVTDSASKVTHDTANGDTAAGICIDFYGQSEAEWSAIRNHGVPRMEFTCPADGTSVSADPIQLLRGAPNRKVAVAFIEFVLSDSGQKLWSFRLGTPGGPVKYALLRLPIRRDFYRPEYLKYMSYPEMNPYKLCAGFEYHPAWTGKYFSLLRVLIKCIALNPLPELQNAWREIIRAGGPKAVPKAMAKFNALPFAYSDANKARRALTPAKGRDAFREVLRTQREWSEFSRKNYREAAELARRGE